MNIISNRLRAFSRAIALACAVFVALPSSQMQAQSFVGLCKDYCSYALARLPFATAISGFVQKHKHISLSLAIGTAAMFVVAALMRSKETNQQQQQTQPAYGALNVGYLREQKEKEKGRKIKIMLQRGQNAEEALKRANDLKSQYGNFSAMVRQLDAVVSLMNDHVGDVKIGIGSSDECQFFDESRKIEDCLKVLLTLVKELEPNTEGSTKKDIKNLCADFYENHYKNDEITTYLSSILMQQNAQQLLIEWQEFYSELKAKIRSLYELDSSTNSF